MCKLRTKYLRSAAAGWQFAPQTLQAAQRCQYLCQGRPTRAAQHNFVALTLHELISNMYEQALQPCRRNTECQLRLAMLRTDGRIRPSRS